MQKNYPEGGSDRAGQIILATGDLPITAGIIDQDPVRLPSGLLRPGIIGQSVEQHLGRGTLAVALGRADKHTYLYMPVTIRAVGGPASDFHELVPYPGLEFYAEDFGQVIATVIDTQQIANLGMGTVGLAREQGFAVDAITQGVGSKV